MAGEGVFAFLREHDRDQIAVFLNFTEGRVSRLVTAGSGRVLVSTELDREGLVQLEDLELRPHEGVIIGMD